jgi:hypothetical protein
MVDDCKGPRTLSPRHLRNFVPVADGGRERPTPGSVHVDVGNPGRREYLRLTEAKWRLYSTCFSLGAFGFAGYATAWELMNR